MEDHNLILCSRAEYALIMIDYHLAITIDGKPETGDVPGYQSHYLSTILYPIWREQFN